MKIEVSQTEERRPMSGCDRLLIAASNLIAVTLVNDSVLRAIETIVACHVALRQAFRIARRLPAFAVQAACCVPPVKNRERDNHLFKPGDALKRRSWMEAMPEAEAVATSAVPPVLVRWNAPSGVPIP